ncbi:MAG: Clp protease N-terminal domain-containing protein, partial [Polyangiaceae bacterium]
MLFVRKLAEELAQRKNERTTTGHLLAAIASRPSVAADLLKERRLDVEVLLKAARVVVQDDASDAILRAIQHAREFAARSAIREAGSLHLLFALCQEKKNAAYRALEQCGADIGKLRTAAMQLAMGIAQPRRIPPPPQQILAMPSAPQPRPVPKPVPFVTPVPVARASSPVISAPPPAARKKPRSHHHAHQPKGEHDRFTLDPKVFPTLTLLGKNLTLAAARGELDPVVGRDEEIERTLDVLAKRQANNPCLVGVAGVGKTSVVRGIAQRIAEGKDVISLDDRLVIEIEPATLLAGTGMRGALAERIALLKAEVKKGEGRIVLFFDEMHTLFGADAGDEATSELKIALAKGELVCIGATTHEEYRKVVESDTGLARRFTPVEVDELSPEEAFLALESIAPLLESHHCARITKEALAATITWSVRYIPGRALPDKAVSILDLAGA